MLGYIKPYTDELKVKEQRKYKSTYCAVCKGIGRLTILGRLLLAYDCVFLALLADQTVESCTKRPCFIYMHKCSYKQNKVIKRAATINVVLGYFKLCDSVQDGNPWAVVPKLLLYPSYKRAAREERQVHIMIKSSLQEINALEKGFENPLQSAEKFGNLCADIAGQIIEDKDENYIRTAREIACHCGSWVYWMDAVEDYPKDKEKKRYNTLSVLMQLDGISINDAMIFAGEQMKRHMEQATLALALLENENKILLENIIEYSIPFQTKRLLEKEGIALDCL